MKQISLYYFLLFAIGISCNEIVFVEDISDEEVSVLAPLDQAEVNSGAIIFSWETAKHIETYQLQLATPSFEHANQILLDTIITTRSFTKSLGANTYEWRLRGVNSQYETNYRTQRFVVTEIDDLDNL